MSGISFSELLILIVPFAPNKIKIYIVSSNPSFLDGTPETADVAFSGWSEYSLYLIPLQGMIKTCLPPSSLPSSVHFQPHPLPSVLASLTLRCQKPPLVLQYSKFPPQTPEFFQHLSQHLQLLISLHSPFKITVSILSFLTE